MVGFSVSNLPLHSLGDFMGYSRYVLGIDLYVCTPLLSKRFQLISLFTCIFMV